MARANFVKRAKKCPRRGSGIYKGDSYWWWKFNRLPKQISKTRPTRAQLTRSPFLSAIYQLEDGISGITSHQEAEDYLEYMKETLGLLKDECEESLEALPENLREVTTGEMLQERINGLEEWLSNLESVDLSEHAETDGEEFDDMNELVGGVDIHAIIQSIQDCNPGSF